MKNDPSDPSHPSDKKFYIVLLIFFAILALGAALKDGKTLSAFGTTSSLTRTDLFAVVLNAGTTNETLRGINKTNLQKQLLDTTADGTGFLNIKTGVSSTFTQIDTNGNVLASGLKLKALGDGATYGTAVLGVNNRVIVISTRVTASTIIFVTPKSAPDGSFGGLSVDQVVPGISFRVSSSDAGDFRTFNYLLIEPY